MQRDAMISADDGPAWTSITRVWTVLVGRLTCKESGGASMAETTIDYQAVFRTQPGVLAVVTPDGVILDANEGCLEAAGCEREHALGRNLFELFPENPDDPGDKGPAQLRESFDSVVASGEPDAMKPIRYDVQDPGRPGAFEERYWAVTNTPLHSPEGQVMMIAHKADEITHIVNQGRNQLADQG